MSGPLEPVVVTSAGPGQPLEPPNSDERPVGELVHDAWLKAESLIRQEIKLGLVETSQHIERLKTQLQEDSQKLKRELVMKVVGGSLVLVGALALTACVVLSLSEIMPAWLAALIVGAVLAAGGAAMLRSELELPDLAQARAVVPGRAAQNVQTDVRAVKEALK